MNKKTNEKKNIWQWLQALIRILQMLAWWNKKRPTPIARPVSVISGPQSSTQSSRSQPLSSLRSESKVLGRKIDYLVLHCSDTSPDQDFTIEKLRACHKARGFGVYPGYHVYVRRDGSVYYCRPVRLIGCHVKGHNSNSIGVCYEGGRRCERPSTAVHEGQLAYTPVPYGRGGSPYEDNRTQAQKEALREVFAVLHECFPQARIVGHNELGAPKACPCLSKAAMEAFRAEICG